MTTYHYHKQLLFLCLRFLEGSAGQGKDNKEYLIEKIIKTLKCGGYHDYDRES